MKSLYFEHTPMPEAFALVEPHVKKKVIFAPGVRASWKGREVSSGFDRGGRGVPPTFTWLEVLKMLAASEGYDIVETDSAITIGLKPK